MRGWQAGSAARPVTSEVLPRRINQRSRHERYLDRTGDLQRSEVLRLHRLPGDRSSHRPRAVGEDGRCLLPVDMAPVAPSTPWTGAFLLNGRSRRRACDVIGMGAMFIADKDDGNRSLDELRAAFPNIPWSSTRQPNRGSTNHAGASSWSATASIRWTSLTRSSAMSRTKWTGWMRRHAMPTASSTCRVYGRAPTTSSTALIRAARDSAWMRSSPRIRHCQSRCQVRRYLWVQRQHRLRLSPMP